MRLGGYKNGNYFVDMFSDGTKIRRTSDDKFVPEYPESMDLKITNCCNQKCAFCHEDSKPNGKHADILNMKFIDTLLPYTEIAIGGGDPMLHPDLEPFLIRLKKLNIIANITVHQERFMESLDVLHDYVERGLLYGIGVSIHKPSDELILEVQKFENAVVHLVAGVVGISTIEKLYDKGLKILLLGYKTFRRGVAFKNVWDFEIEQHLDQINSNLEEIVKHFSVVSFDNLAISQLMPCRLMTRDEWEQFYMGDDGQFTMYVDAVNREYAVSSISVERYTLEDDVATMFDTIRKGAVT